VGGSGGAVRVAGGSALFLRNSIIAGCFALVGGALSISLSELVISGTMITGCGAAVVCATRMAGL
jgi:hypothetical protein